MAADFHPSHYRGIPILLNVDNTGAVTLEHFPALVTEQMNLGISDQQERNLSLEDLCKAANSDLIASNGKADDPKSYISTLSSAHLQSNNHITGLVTNVGLNVKEATSTETKQNQFNIKDNKCNYCGKVCTKRSILEKHLRAHTNERPYPCEECGVHFKTKSNLYKHCKSRSHLIQTAQATTQKDNLDGNLEGISTHTSLSNIVSNKHDPLENTSNSFDGQDHPDKTVMKTKSPVFVVNQLRNGQVILEPLNHVGINASSLGSTVATSVSSHNLPAECLSDSRSNANCQRPFLKSLSEKGPSKAVYAVKPHSQSFSNEIDIIQIPKFDKTMTNDDIQRRISMIISLNDYIIDTPKEIKNHRFRKIVRDFSDSISQDSSNGKFGTRSNSITPTFTGSDNFVSFCQASSSTVSKLSAAQQSNFLSTPINDRLFSSVLTRSSSDGKPYMSSPKLQDFSLQSTGSQDQIEFKSLTKSHSFGNSQSVLMSKSESSLKAASAISTSQHHERPFSGVPLEITRKSSLEGDHYHLLPQSIDSSSFQSPGTSPSSSPVHLKHLGRHKRGRPKGSKNKLKLSPTFSTSSYSIVPSIHITSVEEQPPENHWKKELKRHLLMKRSMSNENPSDKEQTPTTPNSACPLFTSSVSSFSSMIPCASIAHLSPSSIPIKKRRKTLTELGRGTAFGTTVDDHTLDLNGLNRKNLTKPLWSSDGSFGKTFVPDDRDSLNESKQVGVNHSNKIDENLSESTLLHLKELNTKLQVSPSYFVNISSQNVSYRSKSLATGSSTLSNLNANYSFVTFGDMSPQTSESGLLPLNLLKEKCILIPAHYINRSAQLLGIKESNALENMPALRLMPSNQNPDFIRFSPTPVHSESIPDSVSTESISLHAEGKVAYSHKVSYEKEKDVSDKDSMSLTTKHLRFKGHSLASSFRSSTPPATENQNKISNCLCKGQSNSLRGACLDVCRPLSDISANECLLRDRLDSEAAASLLDLSKSRQPPSDEEFAAEECNLPASKVEISMTTGIVNPLTSICTTYTENFHPLGLFQATSVGFIGKKNYDGHSSAFNSKNIKSFSYVEDKHVCNICQETFQKEHLFYLHKNLHYMEKPFRCGKCQATFQSNWLLKKHHKKVHHMSKSLYDPRPYKCLECKVAFRTRGHLAKHGRSKLHSQKLRFKKTKCSDSSENEIEFNEEKPAPSSGKSVVSFVPVTMQESVHMTSDNGSGSGDIDYSTTKPNCFCGNEHFKDCFPTGNNKIDTTTGRVTNETHAELVTRKPDYSRVQEIKCKKLSLIGRLQHHDMADLECENISSQNEALENHNHNMRSIHGAEHPTGETRASSIEDYMMFCCRVCSAIFKDPPSLLLHYEGHLEQRVHVCNVCDAGFKTSEGLKAHMGLHAEKQLESQGIQTYDEEISSSFQSYGDLVIRRLISNVQLAAGEPSNVLLAPNIPQTCLTMERGKLCPHFPPDDICKSVPIINQNCVMSSGQISSPRQLSPFPQISKQHFNSHVMSDAPLKKVVQVEGISASNSPNHLLLQSLGINNNVSLIPQNTLLLLPPEASKNETSPKPQEVFFYNPSGGYFFVASGRSPIGQASSSAKSLPSLAISAGTKPV